METKQLIEERGKTHGPFRLHAEVKQKLISCFNLHHINPLDAVQRTGLEMIFEKISRICAGDPSFEDHWEDIAGYATLVVKDIRETKPSQRRARPAVRSY